jgi:hypothetical protein
MYNQYETSVNRITGFKPLTDPTYYLSEACLLNKTPSVNHIKSSNFLSFLFNLLKPSGFSTYRQV